MRWKLLVITSLAAALIGVCGSVFSVYALFRWDANVKSYELLTAAALFPLIVALAAAVIVYRRTSRRRKLQAGLTALLILVLTGAMFPYVLKHFSTLPDPLPMIY